MSRRARALVGRPARPFAILLAGVLSLMPLPAPGPAGEAEANAAGPPGVESLDAIQLVGEFVVAGEELGHIVLTWDEIIDPRFIPDGADFTITINGIDHPAAGVDLLFSGAASDTFAFGDDGLTFMRLDLPAGVTVALGDSVQLRYTPGATPVRDLALTPAPGFAGVAATVDNIGFFDHLVSVVDSYHGANKVVMVLSDPIEPGSLPAPSQFAVTVDGLPATVTSVIDLDPAVGMAFLELTLDTTITDPSSSVMVDYTSLAGTLVSRYRGETLGDRPGIEVTVIIATNSKAATLEPEGELSTAGGSGPTPGDPVATTIFSPSGGDASITEGSVDFPAPPGFAFFGHQVVIEMTDAPSEAMPNVLTFAIDASIVPVGQDHTTIQIFRDGVIVPDCEGDPGVADPSPCVAEREPLAGGDIGLTVLTVQASAWNLGLSLLEPFDFGGFLPPVDADVPNVAIAGRAIPITFSLGGDRGLDIFAEDSPSTVSVDCNGLGEGDVIEQTVTAGSSSLSYDAASDRYTYVWKTNKAWDGSCRRLTLAFADGSVATATFDFRR